MIKNFCKSNKDFFILFFIFVFLSFVNKQMGLFFDELYPPSEFIAINKYVLKLYTVFKGVNDFLFHSTLPIIFYWLYAFTSNEKLKKILTDIKNTPVLQVILFILAIFEGWGLKYNIEYLPNRIVFDADYLINHFLSVSIYKSILFFVIFYLFYKLYLYLQTKKEVYQQVFKYSIYIIGYLFFLLLSRTFLTIFSLFFVAAVTESYVTLIFIFSLILFITGIFISYLILKFKKNITEYQIKFLKVLKIILICVVATTFYKNGWFDKGLILNLFILYACWYIEKIVKRYIKKRKLRQIMENK